ncbi:MAG: zinc ABC transporter substrate-binding protein [Verrucomicrobia bacterium]|nr:zinc ABC transporter substrate-binding protein [Verrucomicrobiota bacterium]
MKRFLISNLLAMLALAAGTGNSAAAGKLNVVTTLEDLASIARFVGGDDVIVTSFCHGAQDAHFLDAKPSYLVKLNRADVLIENGGELESSWLSGLVDGARNRRILGGAPGRVVAMDAIEPLEVPAKLDRSEGDVHPQGNPHFTLDPSNARPVAARICAAFCAVAPEKAERFRANLAAFDTRLDKSLARWMAMMAPLKGLKIVTFHRNFSYLARRFDWQVVGTLEPKPGVPPSPGHLANLIVTMKTQGAKLILAESYRDLKVAQFAAEKSGAVLLVVPTGVGGNAETPDFFHYFDWLLDQIAKAGGR